MGTQGKTPDVGRLLSELCDKLGFTLPADPAAQLPNSPHPGIDALTDAVLLAEGLDPQQADEELRKQVRDCVARYLKES